MNNYYYDLHIHSCLSSCGDNEMTPNNIANMAKLNGLDFIALSDHNSCKNCEAIMEVGKKIGLPVLPAMELTTSEDIHILCLFPTLDKALDFEEELQSSMLKIRNKPDIYGEQIILDANDEKAGTLENLLVVSSGIDCYDVAKTVEKHSGVSLPAHIDKSANSILSILGSLEKDMGFSAFELSKKCDLEVFRQKKPQLFEEYMILQNSDAHYLWDINDPIHSLALKELSTECIIDTLRQKIR